MNAQPLLAQLFGAYLHQDWDLEFSSSWDAVHAFRASLATTDRERAVSELHVLLELEEGVLRTAVFEELGLGYWPEGDGVELREWLRLVAAELRG